MKEVPAIGFSVRSTDPECDFSPYEQSILKIASLAMKKVFPRDVCLNVNFPLVEKLQGIRVCRLARGNWVEEWIEDGEADTFRLTGHFVNLEPEAEDTDDWATRHGITSGTGGGYFSPDMPITREQMATFLAPSSPNALFIAKVSDLSFIGVPVPCAFICTTSSSR